MRRASHHALPARLGPRRRWMVNATGLGLWVTGVAWLGLHQFGVRQGEFGAEHSPLEAWSLEAHGAFAFLALWVLGLLWGVHVVNGWRLQQRRWTGGVLLSIVAVLILSGYLLYYAGEDTVRPIVSAIHWVVGLGVLFAYLTHRLFRSRS